MSFSCALQAVHHVITISMSLAFPMGLNPSSKPHTLLSRCSHISPLTLHS